MSHYLQDFKEDGLHPAGQRSSKLISKTGRNISGKQPSRRAEKSVLNGLSLTSLQNTCSSVVDKQISPKTQSTTLFVAN